MLELLKPMLADSPARPERKLDDDGWYGQRKFDGVRLLVHVDEGKVIPVNRSGAVTSIPYVLKAPFQMFSSGTFAFDAEYCQDEVLYVFDLPIAGDSVRPTMPYKERLAILEQFHARWEPGPAVQLVQTARTSEEKHALEQQLRDNAAEGMMLKRHSGAYKPGKRSSDVIKFKFWNECDVFITDVGIDGKSNAMMAVYDANGKQINVGTVSTLGKWGSVVEVGSVMSVRYLYAVDPKRPHLVQPNCWAGPRTDKKPEECLVDQIHITNKKVS